MSSEVHSINQRRAEDGIELNIVPNTSDTVADKVLTMSEVFIGAQSGPYSATDTLNLLIIGTVSPVDQDLDEPL